MERSLSEARDKDAACPGSMKSWGFCDGFWGEKERKCRKPSLYVALDTDCCMSRARERERQEEERVKQKWMEVAVHNDDERVRLFRAGRHHVSALARIINHYEGNLPRASKQGLSINAARQLTLKQINLQVNIAMKSLYKCIFGQSLPSSNLKEASVSGPRRGS